MEFKGTKGSGQDQRNYAFGILYPNWDYRDVVGFYEQATEKAFIIGYKQALEDSKAPEMLEMVKKLMEYMPKGTLADSDMYYEAHQLIKKATEL